MPFIKFKFRQNHISIGFLGISVHVPLFYSLINNVRKKRYLKNLARIQNKKVIKVAFLVSEPSKWGYQSIYDTMAKDKRFEPFVLVHDIMALYNGKNYYTSLKKCYDFFKQNKIKVKYAYNKNHIPYDDFDILFYQQPYGLDNFYCPFNISRYAITCYCPYGFELSQQSASYMEEFHRWIDFVFVPTKGQLEYTLNISKKINNCYLVGYPKLDIYRTIKNKKLKKPIIIYAPHHSFEKHGLSFATFQWNGSKILEIAKKHPEFDYVFKPHPRFKYAAIANNIMTDKEVDNYYKQWEKIGKIYEGGDYIDLFKNSSALITDCSSFLGEYLPSGHPVLHLISENAKFNDFAKSFISGYYQIHNEQQLSDIFNRVIVNGDDYKKSERLNKIQIVFNEYISASDSIIKLLNNKLTGKA